VIAGVAAPAINGAACPDERSRGINAAVELANLLNSGSVTLGPLSRDAYGRKVRNVQVKGEDVTQRMINDGLVRAYDGTQQRWCS
jgi:endonuclease YncB( thermonuclease family)